MTYIMSSGTLNPCIPYHTIPTQQYQFLMISNILPTFTSLSTLPMLSPIAQLAVVQLDCRPVGLSPRWPYSVFKHRRLKPGGRVTLHLLTAFLLPVLNMSTSVKRSDDWRAWQNFYGRMSDTSYTVQAAVLSLLYNYIATPSRTEIPFNSADRPWHVKERRDIFIRAACIFGSTL